MLRITLVLAVIQVTGCYHGSRASRGVNEAWRGYSRTELTARWGAPARVEAQPGGERLVWQHRRRHLALPSGSASVSIDTTGDVTSFDVNAELRPGVARTTVTEVVATVDAAGRIAQVTGPSLRWGAPSGANLRWGTLFGFHAGMGRLDDTSTPLPSGSVYIGGMLGPRHGLVGTYSFVSGKDDAGGAIGMAWGMGVQWWPSARIALRGGPAMVLAFDPGFENVGLEPGVGAAASFAIVRAGSFVLDLRLDLTAGTSTTFGSVGVGVNVN